MKPRYTIIFTLLILIPVLLVQAQPMQMKAAYSYPTIDDDSLLTGLRSIRNIQYHPDPLGNGNAAFAATNYFEGGVVSVFANAGDDALELVYTTPPLDSLGGNSTPRYVQWGDLDNDGIIEIIFQSNQNGLVIFEWDGVADSWNFGDAPAKIIGPPDIPTSASGYSEYLDPVQDLDGDGVNEIAFAINSSPNDNDRYYVFSITGQYQTGNPGFSAANKEAEFIKSQLPYSSYGGGTPWAPISANLDGEGNKELILHNWNYGHVSPVRITDSDTYVLADSSNDKHFFYSCGQPNDNICFMGAFSADADGDNRDEVYLPFFYNDDRPFPGVVGMVYYDVGSNTAVIDSTNIKLFDISLANNGDNIFGYGYGDYDGDEKVNLYFSGGYGQVITSMEFQGGDKSDQANWELEVLYEGEENDLDRFSGMLIYDSLGTRDTVYQTDGASYFASKFAGRYTDFDKDGLEDMILGFQAPADSHQVGILVWDADAAEFKPDTIYNVLNPQRWSIRMIESNLTGFESRDLDIIMPSDYVLEQNYPNPFNPTTQIRFFLPVQKKISLTVYNALGQKVKTLINNQTISQGSHEVQWNATNEQGNQVATGMYIYELRYGNFKQTKRMMFVK